jgi:hypothetical protein
MANGLKPRVFSQSFEESLVRKIYTFDSSLQCMGAKLLVFWEALLKLRETVLLLEIIYLVPKFLILGLSMFKRRVGLGRGGVLSPAPPI